MNLKDHLIEPKMPQLRFRVLERPRFLSLKLIYTAQFREIRLALNEILSNLSEALEPHGLRIFC
jgi:hypothetical protein